MQNVARRTDRDVPLHVSRQGEGGNTGSRTSPASFSREKNRVHASFISFVRSPVCGVTLGLDPLPGLHQQYGSSLIKADVETQLALLRGDDFLQWAADLYTVEGAFLPILREPLPFDRLKDLYWQQRFRLQSDTWPKEMRAVLHLWDDTYWQLFSTERSDIDRLVQSHSGDPRLALYDVAFDKEYPDPSNEPLQPVEVIAPTHP